MKQSVRIYSLYRVDSTEGVWCARPPSPPPPLTSKVWSEIFLSPKSQVEFWGDGGGGGGGGGVMECQSTPPPPPPQTLTRKFSLSPRNQDIF